MNRHQVARKVLAVIYEHTCIETPEFDPHAILNQLRPQLAFPKDFRPDTASQAAFVESLEGEAHVLTEEELRTCAKTAQTIEAFRYKMQRYFGDGQLPLEWALLLKKFKDDDHLLGLLRDRLKVLGIEAPATR